MLAYKLYFKKYIFLVILWNSTKNICIKSKKTAWVIKSNKIIITSYAFKYKIWWVTNDGKRFMLWLPGRSKMFLDIFLLYYFLYNFSHNFSMWQQDDHYSFNDCETFLNKQFLLLLISDAIWIMLKVALNHFANLTALF